MGSLCCGSGTEQERQINQEINRRMNQSAKTDSTTHRILLLGPGDSGKTTVLKQMRKIYCGTIPSETIDSYSSYIRSKMINYMKILCKQSINLEIPLNDDNIIGSRQFMMDLCVPCDLNPEIVNHLKLLWDNSGIQETLSQREKYQIPDNVSYFFDQRLEDIASNHYIPTFEDYLRIRMRTTGFTEESFKTQFDSDGKSYVSSQQQLMNHNQIKSMSSTSTSTKTATLTATESNNRANSTEYKDLDIEIAKEENINNNNNNNNNKRGIEHTFTFMDVGGQRAERKKWMNMLKENIDAVVYIIAISEYDLMCFEDSTTLRLTEALNLFQTVLKNGFMTKKTVTLFFNKYDLLIEKLNDSTKSTIRDHYPDFPDGVDERNPVEVCEFVYGKFLEIYKQFETGSNSVPHYHRTSALDTDQIDNLMTDIQSDLIRDQLKMAGF